MTSTSSAVAAGVTGIAGMPTSCAGAFVGAVTSCANVEFDAMNAAHAAPRLSKLLAFRVTLVVCMVIPE
jgi:hypothetical protein